MNSIEIELKQDKPGVARRLQQWLLEKAQAWLNGLLAAELDRPTNASFDDNVACISADTHGAVNGAVRSAIRAKVEQPGDRSRDGDVVARGFDVDFTGVGRIRVINVQVGVKP